MSGKEQCPVFPYFGASYPDACCIDGYLYDMDDCDDYGNMYELLQKGLTRLILTEFLYLLY